MGWEGEREGRRDSDVEKMRMSTNSVENEEYTVRLSYSLHGRNHAQHRIVQYNSLQYSTAQYSTVMCSTVEWECAVEYSIMQ